MNFGLEKICIELIMPLVNKKRWFKAHKFLKNILFVRLYYILKMKITDTLNIGNGIV